MNTPRKLFTEDGAYGEVVKEYYIDQTGPYVAECRCEMLFHGPGNHIGEPSPLIETRQYSISFPQLSEAAQRAGASDVLTIYETNGNLVNV